MYLVDTNVVSEARRGTIDAVRWLRSVDPRDIHLSVITLGEIMRGISAKQTVDPTASARLMEWLRKLRHDHADRILPVTGQIATAWGRLSAGRTRGAADGLIAATAIVHCLIIVTRNVSDFGDLGVPLINPWESNGRPDQSRNVIIPSFTFCPRLGHGRVEPRPIFLRDLFPGFLD